MLEPKKRKSVPFSTFSSSICHEVMGPDAMIFVFWMLGFKPALSLSLSLSSRGSLVPLLFLPFDDITCISEAVDISLRNLDSTYDSSSPRFHMMYSAYKLNKAGWQYTALMNSFLNFEPIHCSMSCSDYWFLIWIQVSQETGSCIPISLRIFYSLLWSTQSKALAEPMKHRRPN